MRAVDMSEGAGERQGVMGIRLMGNSAAALRRMKDFCDVESANTVIAIILQAFPLIAGSEKLYRTQIRAIPHSRQIDSNTSTSQARP